MTQRSVYQDSFKAVAQVDRRAERQAIGNLAKITATELIQYKQKQDELKITNYSSQADLEMSQVTQEYRNVMALDPMNKEARNKLSQKYDKILSKYDEDIGIMAKSTWGKTKKVLKDYYGEANNKWVMAQNFKNAETNLNEGIKLSLKQSYMLGLEGDYETALNKANLKEQQLRMSSKGLVSEKQINEDMKNFRSNSVKDFIVGRIESNAMEAQVLLDTEKVQKAIGSQAAVETLRKMSKSQIKRNQNNIMIQQKARAIEASNEMIEDVNSLTLSDIEQMYTGGFLEESDAKALIKFKTDSVYSQQDDLEVYNNINNMISGVELNKNGDKYEDKDISMQILKDSGKMTKESTLSLMKGLGDRRKDGTADAVGIAGQSIKDYLESINNGDIDVNDALAFFNKTVLSQGLKGDKIQELADGVKIAETMKIDPTFQSKDEISKNLRNLKRFDVGSIIVNEQTGEKKHLSKDGRWVNLP